MDLQAAQRQIWANKLAKGFNTTSVPMEICLLQGEIAELFDEWRKKGPGVPEEIADVAIYILSLAQMLNVDLQAAIEHKMRVNGARRYVAKRGTLVKAAPAVSRSKRRLKTHADETVGEKPEALLLPFPGWGSEAALDRFG